MGLPVVLGELSVIAFVAKSCPDHSLGIGVRVEQLSCGQESFASSQNSLWSVVLQDRAQAAEVVRRQGQGLFVRSRTSPQRPVAADRRVPEGLSQGIDPCISPSSRLGTAGTKPPSRRNDRSYGVQRAARGREARRSPRYFASGVGRTWNFTTFGRVPLPPSWCQGVSIE